MALSRCFIFGLFLIMFSLSSIEVGHASRNLLTIQKSNKIEELKYFLIDTVKLIDSATPLTDQEIKEIYGFLKSIRSILKKKHHDATKDTISPSHSRRRLLSINPKPMGAMEKMSKQRKLQNVAVHLGGPRKLSTAFDPYMSNLPADPKLPNLPRLNFPKPDSLPSLLPSQPGSLPRLFPKPDSLPPLPSLPKIFPKPAGGLPPLSRLPIFPKPDGFPNFPKPGSLPRHRFPHLFTQHGLHSQSTMPDGSATKPEAAPTGYSAGEKSTNPTNTGASQTMSQPSSNPSNTQPMNQATNTLGAESTNPSTLQDSQPINRLLAASIRGPRSTPNKEWNIIGKQRMPKGILSAQTYQEMKTGPRKHFR